MTYLQIFNGRLLLMRAQRHIAQATLSYPLGHSNWVPGNPKAATKSGYDAFDIIERALQQLETEFDSKRWTPKQRRAINRQLP